MEIPKNVYPWRKKHVQYMSTTTAFILGLLVSRWLDEKMHRYAVRIPYIENIVRRSAEKVNIDLKQKGRIIKVSDHEAMQSLRKEGDLLSNLTVHGDDNS